MAAATDWKITAYVRRVGGMVLEAELDAMNGVWRWRVLGKRALVVAKIPEFGQSKSAPQAFVDAERAAGLRR